MRENRFVFCWDVVGHRTRSRPMVAKPTKPPSKSAIKHSAIFSLHACLVGWSLIPPRLLSKKGGAQNVTMWAKRDQVSQELAVVVGGASMLDEGMRVAGGLMSGAGATLRSGFVRVFARLRPALPSFLVGCRTGGARVVGSGTAELS